eukprot:TRINITY_DN3733_c0_g3_i2.p1 TRINITY_DN3733_c0_g3~~TRINITY_DN3733_c0_g3_i2.p1  ORF type:complete len:785 (+),score=156.21 TRINITY_DN3733_c0_g3_i2:594-2948(+)
MSCLRGSCATIPDGAGVLIAGHSNNQYSPVIIMDPFCTSNGTMPPTPAPTVDDDSDDKEKSLSLLATVTIMSSFVCLVVLVALVLVWFEARFLSAEFTIGRLERKQSDARRLSDMRALEYEVANQPNQPYHGAPEASLLVQDYDLGPQQLEQLHVFGRPSDQDSGPLVNADGIGLLFENVGYSVGRRHIVKSITGVIQPGSMVGLLGPSGAGKSSFLDIVAGRVKVGRVSGSVSMFHEAGDGKPLKANVAYVLQDDVLVGTDTVAETLLFAARLKNPGATREECYSRVSKVLGGLHLNHIANSYIGNGVEGGGISGGERKRVSIGVELVCTPSCLVLDEPTSGLDSTSTIIVLEVLRKVANDGCSVIFSIHQPSLKAFLKFDEILLVSCHGQQLFMGSPHKAMDFFRGLANQDRGSVVFPEELHQQLATSGTPKLEQDSFENPAELLLDAASIQREESLFELSQSFFNSSVFEELSSRISKLVEHQAHPNKRWKPLDSVGAHVAMWLLLKRSTRSVLRDPMLLVGHVVVMLVIACCLAAFAQNLPLDFVGVQTRVFLFNFLVLLLSMVATSSMGALIKERSVFVRERTAHFYPAWCYCATKFICDFIPLRTLPTILLAYVIYWPVGLRQSDQAFCKFLLSLLMASYTAATTSLFFSALCRDVGQANLLAASYTIYSFIFSGMLLTGGGPESQKVRFTSTFFYPWEAMCGAEFGGKTRNFLFNPKIGGEYVIPGDDHGMKEPTQALLDNFSLEDRFAFDMMMMAMFIVVFGCSTLAILTFRRFAK